MPENLRLKSACIYRGKFGNMIVDGHVSRQTRG
jgi:hypothetical protein